MHVDPAATRSMQCRLIGASRRSPWMKLLSALLALGHGKGELVRHSERPWASATFCGTRHTVALRFAGDEAVAAGERFVAELPDHEFTIRGHLVADALVISADHTLLPAAALEVEVELLLLEE